MARPQVKISKKIFENLCALQCTEEEIADAFDASADTILRWCKREYGKSFAEVFAQKRNKGRISLRRMQWRLAKTSAPMAIWLGKQFLGQKDSVDVSVTESKGFTLGELEQMVLGSHAEDYQNN